MIVNPFYRDPFTGDCRYRRPICGAWPTMSNAAVSSSTNNSGEAGRLPRHHCRFRVCVRLLQVWFGPAGSPALAQLV